MDLAARYIGMNMGLCMTAAIRLKLENIVKEYPGCRANDGIDLTVGAGEIHALLGFSTSHCSRL